MTVAIAPRALGMAEGRTRPPGARAQKAGASAITNVDGCYDAAYLELALRGGHGLATGRC